MRKEAIESLEQVLKTTKDENLTIKDYKIETDTNIRKMDKQEGSIQAFRVDTKIIIEIDISEKMK